MSEIANQISNGSEILGSMIAWELDGVSVTYNALVTALRSAGIDDSVVRAKQPRQAFTQAARKLSDQRVIDKLDEDETDIRFQFTKRSRENGEFEYQTEAILTLSKFSGRVFCEEDPELADLAEDLVAQCMDTYTGANISAYLRQLFKENADIFSFSNSGVYLVPAAHEDFLEQVDQFVTEIGGRLSRLPIAKGTKHGDKAFRDTISTSIEKKIQAHIDTIEALTPDNMNKSFESRAREINETRYKIEVYAAYLGSEAQRLLDVVQEAKQRLRTKIMEASATVDVN